MVMVDFSFTPEQEALREVARKFAEEEVEPKVKWMDEKDEVPMDLIKRVGELGFMSVLIPRKYAEDVPYAGMGHVARTIILEELGRVSPALSQALQIFHLGHAPIIYFGTEEQKERWLPDLATGKKLSTLAMTEPWGGSDPIGSIKMTAKREGDEYVLNGVKVWITNAHIADVIGVVAKTGEGSRGFSVFIVEKNMKGFKHGTINKGIGLRGCNVGGVVLKDCRVPVENRIGEEGEGLKIALHAVSDVGRPGVAATALGIVRRCLEEAAKYSKQRVLYGKPIAELQAIQWHLTDIYMDYQISRLLIYYSAWLRDMGKRVDAENAMGKFWATESAVRCARKLVDIYGAWGNAVDKIPQRLLRDAIPLIAAAGTNEIMRLVMVRKILKELT